MKHVTIIATSLNPDSKSQRLAKLFAEHLESQDIPHELIDLRSLPLPFAGSNEGWEDANAAQLAASVERASHIVFSTPIYCYDTNAVAKNVIELIGRKFTRKVISFLCSAGGHNSYMSIMGLANHLMLDFRSVIVPRFVYAAPSDWEENSDTLKPDMMKRLHGLLDDMKRIQVLES
ncbi:MAG: NAD(P)H-dependent oxidoreductase [Verrucomicrobiota bacterium]